MIKNIVFDIGNVLAGWNWREYYESFHYGPEVTERLARATVLSPLWGEFDRGEEDEEKLLSGFIANDPGIEREMRQVLGNIHDMLVRYDYAVPWLRELKDRNYGLYYLSNFARKAHVECSHVLDFLPLMDGGILSYQERLIKPDPAIYRLLLERYGLKASECVFLDDTPKNVEEAVRQGMAGIVFRDREQAVGELQSLGVNI
ncbi:MAG: HAD family phosphatase [Lachnospiraceae bacterium]|nr:HAD family phosphatase [Lachnospiraceae bacterium]